MSSYTSPYFTLEEVAPGVYGAVVVRGTGAWGNAAIVDMGGAALVFDTFLTPAAAADLRAAAERLAGGPVAYVVNSHTHADHVLGNQAFEGATIIATQGTRELMAVRLPAFLEFARDNPGYIGELEQELRQEQDPLRRQDQELYIGEMRALAAGLAEVAPVLPALTFSERLSIQGNGRAVELITLGAGHTASDCFLHLPDEQVVLMGDLVQTRFHPMMWQGDPENWIATLRAVEALEPRAVVPGHGETGGPREVAEMRRYLEHVLRMLDEARAEGLSADEVAALPAPEAYADWRVAAGFGQNLTALYERVPSS